MIKKIKNNNFKIGFLLLLVTLLSISMITSCSATEENPIVKVPVSINEFGFSREPLPFNNDLYGYMEATDSLNHTHTYYLNDEQMVGLYLASNKTFEYPDGLYLSFHKENDEIMFGNYIIDHIYLPDGTEIQPVSGPERDDFVNNCVEIGKQCDACEEYFGLTTSELADA